MSENFYKDELLDHFKFPRNIGTLTNPDFEERDENPSCGDKVSIQGKVKHNIISDLKFEGSGCVISQATASMLTQFVKGKSLDKVLNLNKDDILYLIGIKLGPTRLKCALLSLHVLQKSIIDYKKFKE